MRFHIHTYRNGQYLCGNVGHVNMIVRRKKLHNVIEEARRLAKKAAKSGDVIMIDAAPEDRPYDFHYMHQFEFKCEPKLGV